MSKKRRDEDKLHDQLRVYRGVIPWSAAEHDWVVATFDERRQKNENLPLPEEFADHKYEFETLKGQELQNIKNMILFSDIFHKRYPKKLEYDAHFYRFNQINKFMQTYHDEFAKLKFVSVENGKHYIAPQLIETLCTMMYDEEDFDESGEWIGNTFSFEDVVAQTKVKINKKAEKSIQNEDNGFKGLIPWSRAEFNWIMDQQLVRGKNDNENDELKDEYLSLKIQMMRQIGKNIDNFDTMALLNEIFHERYPNHVEVMAHFFRYHSIFKFLDKYKNELIKEGFADDTNGNTAFEPELIDSLCVLPYSLEQTGRDGKSYTFLYSEVAARTRAKISARLN